MEPHPELPQPIRSKSQYSDYLARVDELMHRDSLGPEESEVLELLATIIEHFEASMCPPAESTPESLVAHLIEAGGITKAELARDTGIAKATLSNITGGRRGISKRSAVQLANYFGLPVGLFLRG